MTKSPQIYFLGLGEIHRSGTQLAVFLLCVLIRHYHQNAYLSPQGIVYRSLLQSSHTIIKATHISNPTVWVSSKEVHTAHNAIEHQPLIHLIIKVLQIQTLSLWFARVMSSGDTPLLNPTQISDSLILRSAYCDGEELSLNLPS